MKIKVLMDDDTVNGTAAVECDVSRLDEYLKLKMGDVKIYLPMAEILAVCGYTEEHG